MPDSEPTVHALVDELALAAPLVSAGDESARGTLQALLDALDARLAACGSDAQRALGGECGARAWELIGEPAEGRPLKLAALGAAIERLRSSLSPARLAPVTRDGETIELIRDFLTEADESITKGDEILMAIEHQGLSSEDVNALFRVFHTIKGVAGFLDFYDIVALAHATETLLGLAREGKVALEGAPLDRVFDATAMMRGLLGAVRKALEEGTELERVDTGALVAATEEAAVDPDSAGAAPENRAAPSLSMAPPVATLPASRHEPPAGGAKLRDTLKVDVDRVDNFVEMVGELIIIQAMVVHAPEIAALQSLRLQGCLNQLSKISRDLQDVAMRMRMVPVRGLFGKLARMVRELARKVGKDAVLAISGEGTEMDRSMVERLEEPLVHMIRNSLDHGIEDFAGRVRAGKPATATIRLAAYHAGGSVMVEVADDGRGLSREAILKKAKDQGLVGDGDSLGDADVYDLIFAPGFSTAVKVTEISGRGVGMDVVKRTVEAMRGRVHIASTSSQGTLFRFILPLTLAIIDGMLVSCGKEVYIVPSLSIVESLQPKPSMLFSMAGRDELVSVRGELLPLLRLGRAFQIEGAQQDPTQALVVVVENLGRKVALLVDDVIDEQQVVIKSLDASVAGAEHFSGAAILPNGRVGLILNVDRIGAMVRPETHAPARQRPAAEAEA